MRQKYLKRLVVPIFTTVLLMSTIFTSTAYTMAWGQDLNIQIYNYSIIDGVPLNYNQNFNITWILESLKGTPIKANKTNEISIRYHHDPSLMDSKGKEAKPAPQPEIKPAPQPEATPPSGLANDNSNAKHSLTPAEVEMVGYINQAREQSGLQPLAIDIDLSYVAKIKSKDMKDNNYFSHTSPTYGSPFDMMDKFGIGYKSAAENIAINSSVINAHNAFMNSEGHRNNILNPKMTHVGIGIFEGYYTQMFILK